MENNNKNAQESLSKVVINWYILTYGKHHLNSYK